MIPIQDLSFDSLRAWCLESGQPPFRAAQIWEWLYIKQVSSWDNMRNLPPGLRGSLASTYLLEPARLVETSGRSGQTCKLLLELTDGEMIECVVIPQGRGNRYTLCVSSQAGCRFGCVFCASGRSGFRRNLSPGEIVGQALTATRLQRSRPANVVYMGIGEPLDNYDAVVSSLRILNDPRGLDIGARRMTLSTCGVAPGIRRLAGEEMQVELSVSLHAPEDELRSRLMPVNRRYPLSELIPACSDYVKATGRIVTFEYTMVSGVNDSDTHARRLAGLIGGFGSRANLIPLSDVEEYDGRASAPDRIGAFASILTRAGINTTVRASKGGRLRAACGQLRARHAKAASL
jgi:23S rRNA (adenine2503-C2)-methyltransferase